MLLQPSAEVKNKPHFRHSLKWDGFRILLHYDNGTTRAFSREGTEVTRSFFPELERIRLPVKSAVLDGECICFDVSNPSNPPKAWWDDAMARFHMTRKQAVIAGAKSLPAHFPLWDILLVNNEPLLQKSFLERRQILQEVVPNSESLSVTPLFEDGEELFARAKAMGLEGICSYNVRPGAKSLYYLDKRPQDVWFKTKAYQYADCRISGMKKSSFGWSLSIDGRAVGVMEFPPGPAERKAFFSVAKQLVRGESKDWIHLEPLLQVRVKFQCLTKTGMLRSPVFDSFKT